MNIYYDALGQELRNGSLVLFPTGDDIMAGIITDTGRGTRWIKHQVRVRYPSKYTNKIGREKWKSKSKYVATLIKISLMDLNRAIDNVEHNAAEQFREVLEEHERLIISGQIEGEE